MYNDWMVLYHSNPYYYYRAIIHEGSVYIFPVMGVNILLVSQHPILLRRVRHHLSSILMIIFVNNFMERVTYTLNVLL